MEEDDQKELQLLPTPQSIPSSSKMPSRRLNNSMSRHRSSSFMSNDPCSEPPSLDLQLSISLRPINSNADCVLTGSIGEYGDVRFETSSVKALKWQAAEHIRLAAMEKAHAERVRELTRREIEQAQSEFARARHLWERARDEVEKAEKMKERATRQMDSSCMEITCQFCRQKFRA